jgi:putative ABC transport system permease protein
MFARRLPLGWIQLAHHKPRFAMAIAGVGFAVILVFMQLGFMNMLFDTTVMLHKQLNAEIVLVSTKVRDMASTGTIPRRRIIQALGVAGVSDAEALYVISRDWIKPSDDKFGDRGQMLLIGVRPDFAAFKDAEVTSQQPLLTVPGTVLFDRKSRGVYRTFISAIERGEAPTAELSGKTASAQGLFTVGSSFGSEGVLVTSEQTFFLFAPNRTPDAPSLGLVRVANGHDPDDVARRINDVFAGADDTQAMTVPQFIAHSRGHIARTSPVSFVFTFGAVIGLIVGAVVVVQILTTDVQDHLAEYATFKAIGYTNRYLLGIVFEQSLILSVFGFLPGFVVTLGLYEVVRQGLSMPIAMPLDRIVTVFAITSAMCMISGAIAMRRVRKADPAEVF